VSEEIVRVDKVKLCYGGGARKNWVQKETPHY